MGMGKKHGDYYWNRLRLIITVFPKTAEVWPWALKVVGNQVHYNM